ncbi:MAG: sigma-70 family RNA polymerase sigma factor [Deltaproteobacteria bacterium]|nr:sigma-70 family RNA polymerase sigma factor [Deltaproteobacteria bacterium]
MAVSARFQPATVPSEMTLAVPDETLMLRYRDGDAEAFALLYERHKGPLYRYLLRHCGFPTVAEELFQEVWLNIVRSREQYMVQAKFSTYLYRIAHHRLIDSYRRQRGGPGMWDDGTGPAVEDLPLSETDTPENQLHTRTLVTRLMELIRALPEVQREAFLLREEAGMSIEEIAMTTGVEHETAKSRLRYAINRLRRGLVEVV